MKTAFITGATGFLGLNLVHELLASGAYRIICLHRPSSDTSELRKLGVELTEGSLLDLEGLKQAIPQNCDAVFHCAANINMWHKRNAEQTRDNVEGSRNIAEAALAQGVKRFIHTSSIAAYGFHQDRVYETTPSNADTCWINYYRTKYLAEEEIRHCITKGLPAVILNPCNIVGSHDRRGWATLIRLALKGKLLAAPNGYGSFCHAREVAKAHVAAVEKGRLGENYLLGGPDVRFVDFVRTVGLVGHKKVTTRTIPFFIMKIYAHALAFIANFTGNAPEVTLEMVTASNSINIASSDKAKAELGYQDVPLKVMIKDSINWMQTQGMV